MSIALAADEMKHDSLEDAEVNERDYSGIQITWKNHNFLPKLYQLADSTRCCGQNCKKD